MDNLHWFVNVSYVSPFFPHSIRSIRVYIDAFVPCCVHFYLHVKIFVPTSIDTMLMIMIDEFHLHIHELKQLLSMHVHI